MKNYFLKEYGSWSVLVVAFAAGLLVSRGFAVEAVPVFIALGLLVNSKQAFMQWTRRTGSYVPLVVFLAHLAAASVMLLSVFYGQIALLLPLLVLPAAYLIMNRIAGEHHVMTEVLGFGLLSLAAPIAKFTVTGVLDYTLFAGTAVYFIAGVFKVRVQLRKRAFDRIMSVIYIAGGVLAYRAVNLPVIILAPLIDNLIFSLYPYPVTLKSTGWIEVGKSVLFLVLLTLSYR